MTREIKTLAWFAVTTLLALLASQTAAQAQIPSAAGVYTACMRIDRDGDEGRLARLVTATEACRRNEIRITWNQQGPKGDKGDTGIQGPAGARGVKGDTGATGTVGPQGARGDTGASGLQGAKGDVGAKGDTGSTGPQGVRGETGAAGAQGIAGLNFRGGYAPGAIYAQFDVVASNGSAYVGGVNPSGDPADPQSSNWQLLASKGADGAVGPQGPAGAQGLKGDTGATGATGQTGQTGTQGYSVAVGNAPNGACANGGTQVQDGFNHTQYVCNGTNGASFLNKNWFSQETYSDYYHSLDTPFTLSSATRVLISASVSMSNAELYGVVVGCLVTIDGGGERSRDAISIPGTGQMTNGAWGSGLFTSSQVYGPLAPGQHQAGVFCQTYPSAPVYFGRNETGLAALTQLSVLQVQ